MPTSLVFANEGVEKEFTIEVNKPNKIESNENKKETLSSGYDINVEKPKNMKKEEKKSNLTEEEMRKLLDEYKPKFQKDPLKPSTNGNAKGKIIESVGSDNQSYPVRKEIKNEKKESQVENKGDKKFESIGENQKRPLAERREFLSFQTKSGKTFHLIIDRDKDVENVQLVTEVTEQDLLNMILSDTKVDKPLQEEKPKVEKITETPKKEEPKKEKSGSGSFLILGIVAIGVLGAGYYFKIYKPKQENNSDFDDFEDESDDYFLEEKEDTENIENENLEIKDTEEEEHE